MTIVLGSRLAKVGMKAASDALIRGEDAIDILKECISPVEADPNVKHVGYGGWPNALGVMECDAAVVNGKTRGVGIIAGLKGYLPAFKLACRVLTDSPHVAIGGEGAALFAKECGFAPQEMLSELAAKEYEEWKKKSFSENLNLTQIVSKNSGFNNEKDTVIVLVKDANGDIAAGGSTSGWGLKFPGRYGDTPLPGAGLWADNDGGACGCTFTGEMTARCLTAKSVVDSMRRGATVKEAVHDAISDFARLEGGYQGPVIVHAIDKNGEPYVASTDENIKLTYRISRGESAAEEAFCSERHSADYVPISYP